MLKHVVFRPEGVCAKEITFDLIDGFVHNVKFDGGCSGNTKGVAILSEGRWAEDLAAALDGVACHNGHSCPAEFSKAISKALLEMKAEGKI